MTHNSQANSLSTAENQLDYDLAIVGGGIVGTTLAAALQKSNLKIIIIEAQTLEQTLSKRQAYALSLLSGRIFEGIGVWREIVPQIGKFRHIRLSDAEHPHPVQFETKDLNTDYLGYVGEHQVILSSLYNFLRKSPQLNWLSPAQVLKIDYKPDYVSITVNSDGQTQQIRCKLLVGADGQRSQVRANAEIRTQGWKYWQSCVAFTISHQAPNNDIAFERFWPSGPMGILPLPGNRCQIVWSAPHAEAKALQELNEQEFIRKLEYRTGGLLGKLELVSPRVLFPVQMMQSCNYVKPRLALIGDAAHGCHPVGGQGLNMGIRDAATLAQIIAEAQEKGQDFGNIKVLKQYERWRKRENWAILGITDFLNRFFSNNSLPLVTVRRFGLWIMRRLPPLKVFMLEIMTGLKGKPPYLAQN